MHPKGSRGQCLRFIFINFLFVQVQSTEFPGDVFLYRTAHKYKIFNTVIWFVLLWEIRRDFKYSVIKYLFVKNWNLQSAFSTETVHNQHFSNIFIKNCFKPSFYLSVSFQYPSLYQCHFCFRNYFNYFCNNTFSLYPFFCRGLIFSFQSFLTSLITKAAVNRLQVAKNSHWFSVFTKSCVFVGTDLLVSFEHHQSALMDVHCIRGLM